MTRPHIGWYVGDGGGARARFRAVRPHLGAARLSVLTLGPAPDLDDRGTRVVELPWTAGAGDDRSWPGSDVAVHLEPDVARRVRTWVDVDPPQLLVVDGHTRLAGLAGRLGVTVAEVRRPGSVPSRVAGTVGELAPYPVAIEPSSTPPWVRERTVHTGLLSRYAGRRPNRLAGRRSLGLPADARVVTVICGRDGLGPAADLAAAARATPGWTWLTVGRCGTPLEGVPDGLLRLGWSDDPWPALEAADVVVGSGSLAVVAEVASARRPFVLVPRPGRLGDEVVARALGEAGVASTLTRWPRPEGWAAVLADARQQDPALLARFETTHGPRRAAERLLAWSRSGARGARPDGHQVQRPVGPVTTVIDLTRSPLPAAAVDA